MNHDLLVNVYALLVELHSDVTRYPLYEEYRYHCKSIRTNKRFNVD